MKADGAGIGVADVEHGSPVTIMDGDLCATGSTPVAITSVKPLTSTGRVTVAGWGVRPDTGGSAEYRAFAYAIGARHTPVGNHCGDKLTTELDVELRSTSTTATVQSFRVSYDGGFVDTHLAVALCEPSISSSRCGKLLSAH